MKKFLEVELGTTGKRLLMAYFMVLAMFACAFTCNAQVTQVTVTSVKYSVHKYDESTEEWELMKVVNEPIVYTVGETLVTVKNNTVSMVLTVIDVEFDKIANTLFFTLTDGGREYYLFIDSDKDVVSFAFEKEGNLVSLRSVIHRVLSQSK